MNQPTPRQDGSWPDKVTLQPLYDLIKQARALTQAYLTPLARSSQQDYERRHTALLAAIDGTACEDGMTRLETFFAKQAPVSRTFFKNRAILCRRIAEEIRLRLAQQDQYQKACLFDIWKGLVQSIEEQVERLERVRQLDRADLLERSGQSTAKSRTKRYQKLPQGWADRMLEASRASEFYDAVLTLRFTGCRPAEIDGARFTYAQDKVYIQIKGKKVTEDKGQPLRKFAISAEKFPKDFLNRLKKISAIEIKGPSNENDLKRLRMYLNRTGRALFPRLKKRISAINFRHAMASELRDAGWEKHQIAGVMGHISENTQSHYGARRNCKGIRPKAMIEKHSVQTARHIRIAKRSPFLGDNPPKLENARRNRRTSTSGVRRPNMARPL